MQKQEKIKHPQYSQAHEFPSLILFLLVFLWYENCNANANWQNAIWTRDFFCPFKLVRSHRCNDAIALHVNWHIWWCLKTVTFFENYYILHIQQSASRCWNIKKSKLKSWIRWKKAKQQPVACTRPSSTCTAHSPSFICLSLDWVFSCMLLLNGFLLVLGYTTPFHERNCNAFCELFFGEFSYTSVMMRT